jgi:hypothetical protein
MRFVSFSGVLALAIASVAGASPYSSEVLYQLKTPVAFTGGFLAPRSGDATQTVGNDGLTTGGSAVLWAGPSGVGVDLTPAGYNSAFVYFTSGGQQAGYGTLSANGNSIPLIWSGTAGSVEVLTPPSFNSGAVSGTDGVHQVGYAGGLSFGAHAMLWTGTAASAVDLNPTNLSGFTKSVAIGIYGSQEVGNGSGADPTEHALLWNGTADSAVDLNPAGFYFSSAHGTSGAQQVGFGMATTTSPDHALLWSGTAASVVDLNPAGFAESDAEATNGQQQVGSGVAARDRSGALVWSGSASSVTYLQNYLPTSGNTSFNESVAYYIDSSGNIFGTASGTNNGVQGTFAVEWSPVPEPGSISALMCVCLSGLLGRGVHRNRKNSNRANQMIEFQVVQ